MTASPPLLTTQKQTGLGNQRFSGTEGKTHIAWLRCLQSETASQSGSETALIHAPPELQLHQQLGSASARRSDKHIYTSAAREYHHRLLGRNLIRPPGCIYKPSPEKVDLSDETFSWDVRQWHGETIFMHLHKYEYSSSCHKKKKKLYWNASTIHGKTFAAELPVLLTTF